ESMQDVRVIVFVNRPFLFSRLDPLVPRPELTAETSFPKIGTMEKQAQYRHLPPQRPSHSGNQVLWQPIGFQLKYRLLPDQRHLKFCCERLSPMWYHDPFVKFWL